MERAMHDEKHLLSIARIFNEVDTKNLHPLLYVGYLISFGLTQELNNLKSKISYCFYDFTQLSTQNILPWL
jgi:hypothetical protein